MAPSSVSAIVATLDLQVVRGLRAALQDDVPRGAHPLGPAPQHVAPRQRDETELRIDPRPTVTPSPRFDPRPVHRPEPRFAPGECLCPPSDPLPAPDGDGDGGRCPIEPPWKVRPWEAPVPIKLEVKVVTVRPDIVHKGSLIDFFC